LLRHNHLFVLVSCSYEATVHGDLSIKILAGFYAVLIFLLLSLFGYS